ncbi:MAG: transglycosylase SLT domain-containing protein [Muribaculaceae bacterium]|mgnify:CR=1 FL=1|jgi:membrane-bound lytic murein transglycosylase F
MATSFIHIAISAALIALTACGSNHAKQDNEDKHVSIVPDTLHAATLYGPTSYFNYRGQQMGFDYENLKRFADDEGMVLDLKVASSLQSLLRMVSEGEADLAAYPVPSIEEYNKIVKHCGHKEVTWQVLVQPAGKNRISDVTELVGKTVYVEQDSKYHYRLNNLNKELGGGIDIVPISRDSLITEDLIEMVDHGEIPLTVVDSDIAELNKSYYPRLDIDMKISLDQYASWAVRNDCDSLAARLDRWEKRRDNSETLRAIYKKYFEISKNSAPYEDPALAFGLKIRKGGSISPYDNLFKRHSSVAGYDWRLLAAIGFNESRFDNNVESWAGARGIMQLMPSTAKAVGIKPESISNPDANILGAARLLKKLDAALAPKVPDPEERMRFVIASYNCGLGHIFDAIELASKHGLNPEVWLGNVSEAALMKSRPLYYNDPVVKNGYFRGRETTEFVERVMSVFEYFKSVAH